jgi:hypothetical protein
MLLCSAPSTVICRYDHMPRVSYQPSEEQLRANATRAFLLFVGNFVFALAVLAATAIDVPKEVDQSLLLVFMSMEAFVLLIYIFTSGWDFFYRIADEIAGKGPNGDREWTASPLNRILPIWIVVAFNFVPVAYLIHMTGGPAASPYIAIPPTILLIGQLLKKGKAKRQRGLVIPVIRFFWLFLLIGLLFYCALVLWEVFAPADNGDLLTTIVAVVFTFGLYFMATWTNYFSLSRNFRDESSPSPPPEPAKEEKPS